MGIEVNLPTEGKAPPEGVILDFSGKKAEKVEKTEKVERAKPLPNGSPFQHAPQTVRRPKIFLWGDTGTKKTRTALEFPHVVVIDTESGTELYGRNASFDRIVTSDFDEADKAVAWLLKNKHSYSTVVVDPITVLWESIQRKWREIFIARRARMNPGANRDVIEDFDFQPLDWQKIKSDLKSFIHKLIMLDTTVIITARQKALVAGEGKDFMKKIGETFDGEKSLPYLFDIIVHTFKNEAGEFVGEVVKDRSNRMPKVAFPMGYDVFKGAFGEKELARKAKESDVATEEQLAELRAAFARKKLDESVIRRALMKYSVETEEELTQEQVKIILAKLEGE